MDDGLKDEFGPVGLFYSPPEHDIWILGNEPVVIDISVMENYAKPK